MVCTGCRRSQIYRYCIVCLQKLQHHIKTPQCNKKCYTHLGIVIDHSTIVPCQCLCRSRWLLSLWPLMNGTIRWAEVAGSTPYGPLSQICSNAGGGSSGWLHGSIPVQMFCQLIMTTYSNVVKNVIIILHF